MAASSRKTWKSCEQFLPFFGKWPLMVKFSNFCSESLHGHTDFLWFITWYKLYRQPTCILCRFVHFFEVHQQNVSYCTLCNVYVLFCCCIFRRWLSQCREFVRSCPWIASRTGTSDWWFSIHSSRHIVALFGYVNARRLVICLQIWLHLWITHQLTIKGRLSLISMYKVICWFDGNLGTVVGLL